MFEEYAVVKLKRDLPEHNMRAGTRGVVVMVHEKPYRAYEVELIDDENETWAVLTLHDDDLVAVAADEPHREEAA